MRRTNTNLSFWAALASSLAGAALSRGDILPAHIPGPVWDETLRPLLIAISLLALTTAAALIYGGETDPDAGVGVPQIERPALWTVAMLSIIAFLLPLL